MADRIFEADETTAGFRLASGWWCSLVGAVEPHQWDDLALGEWTLRELVVHTDRAEAIGIVTSPPPEPARVALAVVADLVPADDLSVLLRALTGRAQLLPGLDALA